jgi:uncharacterized sodium:solute symporter family permease YidK
VPKPYVNQLSIEFVFLNELKCYYIEANLMISMAKNKEKKSIFSKLSVKKPELDLHSETKRGIAVVVFILLAVISAYSLFFPAGVAGEFWAHLLGCSG